MRLSRIWLLGTSALALAAPLPARAQAPATVAAPTAPAAAGAAPDSAGQIQDIIVTSTKRSELLQDIPVSVQVLGAQTLDQHQVTQLDDYVRLLPSVSYQSYGPGQSQLFFRGITTAGDGGYGTHGGSPPTSGLYLDEVPVTTIGNAVDLHIYDVNRVEALSGPQGTLFGASSLAGTLRVITNQPDPTRFSAGYELEGNKFGKGDPGGYAQGFVNIPIDDGIAIRLVAWDEHDGGYIDNVFSSRTYDIASTPPTALTTDNARYVKHDYNDVDTFGGRAALRIDLDEDWSITPAILYQDQTAHGSFLFDPAVGDLKVSDYTPEINQDRWWQATLTVRGKIADWDAVYAFGYFGRTVETQADYSSYTVAYVREGYNVFPTTNGGVLDPTQFFRGKDTYTKQTHELRFSSPADEPVRLLIGGFFQRQTDDIYANYIVPGLSSIPNSPAIPGYTDSIFITHVLRTDRDYAAFGEVAWDILDNLTLTGGFRGFVADNTQFGFSGFINNVTSPACLPTVTPRLPCANVNAGVYETGETHKVNLSWKIDPDHLVYFTYSTGFRPGGINRRVTVPPYHPDTLINYEVGWKTSWLDRRLFIDGAAFIENWDQLQYSLPSIGSGGVVSIYNAGNAEVKGIETQATWRVDDTLTLSGSGSYIDAHLTTNFCGFNLLGQIDCSNGIAAPKGTQLPVQPRWKLTGNARETFDLGPVDAYAQATGHFQTATRSWLTDAEANALGSTGDFATVDFALGGSWENWTTELFVDNALDRRGVLSINTVCVPTICGFARKYYPTKPQFLGIKVAQSF